MDHSKTKIGIICLFLFIGITIAIQSASASTPWDIAFGRTSTAPYLNGSTAGVGVPRFEMISGYNALRINGITATQTQGDDVEANSSLLTPSQCTIDVWIYVLDNTTSAYYLDTHVMGNNTLDRIQIRRTGASQFVLSTGTDAGVVTNILYNSALTQGWHLFTTTWNSTLWMFYIDGASVGTPISNPTLPTTFSSNTKMQIGAAAPTPATGNMNSSVRGLRISNKARTPAEVFAYYQGTAIILDKNTTGYFPLETNLTDLAVASLGIWSSTLNVKETAGNATITIVNTGDIQMPCTLSYSTSDGTAVNGVDYTSISGTIVFYPGQTIRTVTIPILKSSHSDNKQFLFTINNPGNLAMLNTNTSITLTITGTSTLTPVADFSSDATTGNTPLAIQFNYTPVVATKYTLGGPMLYTAPDGTIYRSKTGTPNEIDSSANNGGTWTLVYTITDGDTPRQLRKFDDGRILVTDSGGHTYVSDTSGSNFQLTHTMITPGAATSDNFGVAQYGNIVIIGEYGPHTLNPNPRYIYMSKDEGLTWNTIYTGPINSNFHIHDVMYDPYENLIWATTGDYYGTGARHIIYTPDNGTTWYDSGDLGTLQFTTMIALPQCVLFLSDMTTGAGVYRWDRPAAGTVSAATSTTQSNVIPILAYPIANTWSHSEATFGVHAGVSYAINGGSPSAVFGFVQIKDNIELPLTIWGTKDGYNYYILYEEAAQLDDSIFVSGSRIGINFISITNTGTVNALDINHQNGESSYRMINFQDPTTYDSDLTFGWTFGDTGTSSNQYPSYTYTNAYNKKYTVSLTVTNSYGTNSITKTNYISLIGVLPDPPTAAFTASPTSGNAPLTVTFDSSSSTGLITSYYWDLGTGDYVGTSTQPNPTFEYWNPGNYTVKLTVSNTGGGSTAMKTITVTTNGATIYPTMTPTLKPDYAKWIGATMTPGTAAPTIENPGYNETLSSIGIDPDSPENASTDDFNGPGILGGLTAYFAGMGYIVMIVFAVIIASIFYIKYDGSLLVPGFVFMATGCISGGFAYQMGLPTEMVFFAGIMVVLGFAGALYQAVFSR